MADCLPAQLLARCKASCGRPLLPSQPEEIESAEAAMLRMSGAAVAMESSYAGSRVQVHKLGDHIIVYDLEQQDITSSLSPAELDGMRAALNPKASVVVALLLPSTTEGGEAPTVGTEVEGVRA